MDKFQTMEQDGRDKAISILKKKGFTSICEAVDRYSDFDLMAISYSGKPCVIEVKKRNVSVDTYSTVLLEERKYESITKYVDKGFTPVYLCIYDDGFILFNLKDRTDMTVTTTPAPMTTAGYNEKVMKQTYMLSVTDRDYKYTYTTTL